jgi:trehalose 6-phosphate synthase/phosphatase
MTDETSSTRIINVSYRTPVSFECEEDKTKLIVSDGGLVSAMLSTASTNEKNVWVGYSNHKPREFFKHRKETKFRIYPVNLPNKLNQEFYNGFSNDTLWPLFHDLVDHSRTDEEFFDAYKKANYEFFKTIKKIIKKDDIIWIHDYHLFLLPALIRKHFPDAKIGFFLHIPFPHYELFQTLNTSWQQEIITGVLGSDLVGFHTYDYTQNFLRTVRKVVGVETYDRVVNLNDRLVKVDTFPLGIEYKKFRKLLTDDVVKEKIAELEKNFEGTSLIFSVDRLDYSKGLNNRLLGFEHFLDTHPELISKVTYNMVVVPSRDNIERYQEIKQQIEMTIGRINGKYSTHDWRPIIYQYKKLDIFELVSLYKHSSVGLITPIRDGMNLVAKEYVACQSGTNVGVLILSQRAGAYAVLGEALVVNPYDIKEIGDAIFRALKMKKKEKRERVSIMQKRLSSYTVFDWANDFLSQLNHHSHKQKLLKAKEITESEVKRIARRFHSSNKKVLLLDYDGTIVPFRKNPNKSFLNSKFYKLIEKLSRIDNTSVVIISGRTRTFLDRAMKGLNVVLVAEHGAYIKKPSEEWENQMPDEDSNEWKPEVMNILSKYVGRCSGSSVEKKTTGLVWHYRSCDQDLAVVRSREMIEELHELLVSYKNINIMAGNKVIEVKSSLANKGFVCNKILSENNFDFILGIGDDKTDEDLFESIGQDGFTVKVGFGQTNAQFNLANQREVLPFLEAISNDSE